MINIDKEWIEFYYKDPYEMSIEITVQIIFHITIEWKY